MTQTPQSAGSAPTSPASGTSASGQSGKPASNASGTLFGVPLGDLGWFATLLMSAAAGMAAFFASTFVAIFAILFYNTFTHRNVDFALTYRVVGLPIGLLVLAASLAYLGTLWVRRQLRRA